MPGYVKTDEEIRNIEEFLAPSRFIAEELIIEFETSWAFAREVLPPVFEPVGDESAGRASAFVQVAQYQSAYCGPMDCSIVGLNVTYEGTPGFFQLTEIISGEGAVVLGREIWGEIKKHGTTRIYRDGDRHYGIAERRGHVLLEIEAEIDGPEQAPFTVNSYAFDIKMYPGSDGRGLEYPPRLNRWDCEYQYSSFRTGTGTLKWGNSPWDPTHTIPILATGRVTASNSVACFPLGQQVQLEDPDNIYARYLWGRAYDDPTLSVIPVRWRGVDKLNGERPLVG